MRRPTVHRAGKSTPADATFVTLTYTSDLDTHTLPATDTGASGQTSWAGNILEGFRTLPVATTNNALPLNYARYHALYNKYTVYGCALDLQVIPGATSIDPGATVDTPYPNPNVPILCALTAYQADTPIDDINAFNSPYMKKKIAIGRPVRLKMYMSSSKILGVDYGKDLYESSITMNPTLGSAPSLAPAQDQRWRFYLTMDTPAGQLATQQANSMNCYISYKIKWYVKFFHRKALAIVNNTQVP